MGRRAPSTLPTTVYGGHAWSMILADKNVSCGLDVAGHPYCWGGDAFGYFGVDSTRDTTVLVRIPEPVQTTLVFSQLVVGGFAQCGLDAAGGAWCWGNPPFGDGVVHPAAVAVPVRVRDP